MKNILIFFFFLLLANCVFAQYPTPYQSIGGKNVAVRDTGGLFVRQTFTLPSFLDTSAANQNNYTNQYASSLIFDSTNNQIWVRNATATQWLPIASSGGGGAFGDTVYVRFPLGVDTTSIPGRQIIFIRSPNGLVSGGIVTKSDCWQVSVTPAIYNLNYIQYTTLLSTVNIDTADATQPRIDLIIVDTNALVTVLTGTPAATPIQPYVNPSSQLVLTRIDIPAGATCLTGITVKNVYDENLGVGGGEFDATSSGTISVDYDNPNNPYHLDTAAFVDTYTDGSKLIFTDTGNEDTVAAGEVLQQWVYLNNELFNQIQVQFWMGNTPVSNNIVINPFLNPLDSNEYQSVSVPFSAFIFSSNIFDKIVYTFAGNDTSGAKGLYLDYIQLQKGIINNTSNKVDSTKIIAGFEYYYINGVAYLAGAVGGGGGGVESVTGTTVDNTDPLNPIVGVPDLQQVTDVGNITTNSVISTSGFDLRDAISTTTAAYLGLNNIGGSNVQGTLGLLNYNATGNIIIPQSGAAVARVLVLPIPAANDRILVTSVNGNFADAAGNITISTGSGAVDNIGAGNRLVTSAGANIKTLFSDLTLTIDSSSNTNGLTWKIDTAQIATQYDLTQIVSGINALTGDVTASGTGSVAATLATVNGNVGSFTNANITVNAKGLVTAAANGTSGAVVKETHTAGATITLANATTWLVVNPGSLLAALAVTMAATPTDGQEVIISFGGTLTTGTTVTAFSVVANAGQAILQASTPAQVEVGESLAYKYNAGNSKWYREY